MFVAEKRNALFEDLTAGLSPREGTFDETVLREARTKGKPQMGATRYKPSTVVFEFIYPASAGATIVFSVQVSSPERIVFLPVPGWVIESIWQGEIDGSFHFESDAMALVEQFQGELSSSANEKWFSPQPAKRRE